MNTKHENTFEEDVTPRSRVRYEYWIASVNKLVAVLFKLAMSGVLVLMFVAVVAIFVRLAR